MFTATQKQRISSKQGREVQEKREKGKGVRRAVKGRKEMKWKEAGWDQEGRIQEGREREIWGR